MAQRVGRGIALLFHDRSTRRGEWSAARPARTLPPGKTRYPFYRIFVKALHINHFTSPLLWGKTKSHSKSVTDDSWQRCGLKYDISTLAEQTADLPLRPSSFCYELSVSGVITRLD